MDESDDTPLFKRDVATPTFCHFLDDVPQQPDKTVQSSFTSSPIKTHDFVAPKVAVTAINIQFLFDSTLYIIFRWMQIDQNLKHRDLPGYSFSVWIEDKN